MLPSPGLTSWKFDGLERAPAFVQRAASVLVEEAGGRVTGIDGAPLNLDAPSVLATNGRIHDEMLAVLGKVRKR